METLRCINLFKIIDNISTDIINMINVTLHHTTDFLTITK